MCIPYKMPCTTYWLYVRLKGRPDTLHKAVITTTKNDTHDKRQRRAAHVVMLYAAIRWDEMAVGHLGGGWQPQEPGIREPNSGS